MRTEIRRKTLAFAGRVVVFDVVVFWTTRKKMEFFFLRLELREISSCLVIIPNRFFFYFRVLYTTLNSKKSSFTIFVLASHKIKRAWKLKTKEKIMVQMPTTSSESAPVRLFPFLSSSSSSFFLLLLLLLLLLSCNAREDLFFRGEESPRNEHFCSSPRAGGFPFFSLFSLSLFAEAFWARAFGDLLRRRRLCRSFWCNADWPFPRFILLNNSCFRDATSNRAQQQQLEALAETPSPSWTKNSVETRSWRPSPTRTASRRR